MARSKQVEVVEDVKEITKQKYYKLAYLFLKAKVAYDKLKEVEKQVSEELEIDEDSDEYSDLYEQLFCGCNDLDKFLKHLGIEVNPLKHE